MLTQREIIARDWANSPYYDEAERTIGAFWSPTSVFASLFKNLDLTLVAELACGHGRHAAQIQQHYAVGAIVLIDINASNLEFCRKRFAGDRRFAYVLTSGSTVPLADGSLSALFSYDAMVHFEFDDVLSYIRDTARVLRPGGRALLHHSNNDKQPGHSCHESTHWRNFMSAGVVAHVAQRAGLVVVSQKILDWADARQIDCVTLLQRPL
jgi:ubiquinone/menaquinone biosynthesis C-methylase UbiE